MQCHNGFLLRITEVNGENNEASHVYNRYYSSVLIITNPEW